jgi:UDP-glucose 4-epimerase
MSAAPNILVTGATGFIGSHTVVSLLESGYRVVMVDNLSNSEKWMVEGIEAITGRRPPFYPFDVADHNQCRQLQQAEPDIAGVIHFAAFKAVGESTQVPMRYFRNNLDGLLALCEVFGRPAIPWVFSSSCTVYGQPDVLPVTEEAPIKAPASPYGATKQMGEQILRDLARYAGLPVVALRYFNPIGAHPSLHIGELPQGIPNNLIPYLTQTAAGEREQLTVFGNDYPTPDGTCIRDYIHVVDLAQAHVAALDRLLRSAREETFEAINLGTGRGYSVKEVIDTFERVNQIKVNWRYGPRRPGDVVSVYADASQARQKLGWRAQRDLADMLYTSWQWQKRLSASTAAPQGAPSS